MNAQTVSNGFMMFLFIILLKNAWMIEKLNVFVSLSNVDLLHMYQVLSLEVRKIIHVVTLINHSCCQNQSAKGRTVVISDP